MAYLRAQRLPAVPLCIIGMANLLHGVNCYVFIIRMRLGNFGAGLAYSVTNWFMLGALVFVVHCLRPGLTKQSWIRWQWRQATSNLRSFLAVSLPTAFAIWAEW